MLPSTSRRKFEWTKGESFADNEKKILPIEDSSGGDLSSHIGTRNNGSRVRVCCGVGRRAAIIVYLQLWSDSAVHLGW